MSAASRERLRRLLDEQTPDLAEANLLIATEAYPRLEVGRWLGRVDGLAADALARGGDVAAVVEALRATGVTGDRTTYDDPRNSFLHEVLDRRRGLPIALSALTVAVAARVGLSLAPIAMPGHVLVADTSGRDLRYLDPFDDWSARTLEECCAIALGATGAPPESGHLAPAHPRVIIRRMLVNLTASYLRRELVAEARWTIELQAMVDPDDPGLAARLRAIDDLL